MLSPAVDNLVAQLTKLPGVGQRTAQRLAFHLLSRSKDEALALATAIEEVKERVRFCAECGNLTEAELCGICSDARRDHAQICVVEEPQDLVSLERTHEYRGLYHVLGGALSPLDGVEPEHLRIDELLRRVERNGVKEVVLATNPNMTGEATAAFLAMTINLGAYSTEIIRAGIEAVPKGHIEAGLSLAMTKWEVLRRIVLNQAFRKIYPALSSQIIIVMLGSAVVSQISAEDLTYAANFVASPRYSRCASCCGRSGMDRPIMPKPSVGA